MGSSGAPPRALRTQSLRFLAVGLATLLLDYATYRTLLWLDVPVSPAKLAGFVVGTTATYLLNRAWTFGATGGSAVVARFLVLYAATAAVNVATNAVALRLLDDAALRVEAAFFVAQAVTSTLNFLGLRYLVFRSDAQPPAGASAAARAASSRATGTRNGEHDT